MLKNYLVIAWRNIWRHKGYTTINGLGLAVAFCICVFLFLIAYLQLTFDSFHPNKDRIYQAYLFANDPEKMTRSGSLPLPLSPSLKSEYDEVEASTRILSTRKSTVAYADKYLDQDVVLTDADFLKIFNFPLVKGNRNTALANVSSMVINQDLAQALFGHEDPLGKTVQHIQEGRKKTYLITGVLANAPTNSSIRFEALIRIENAPFYQSDQNNWTAFSHKVFVKLKPEVSQAAFEKKLSYFTQNYFAATLQDLKAKGAKPDEQGQIFALRLQSLPKVHFDTALSNGPPLAIIYVLLGIGLFIMIIASINFINLSIARSFTRAKEVGVRKYLGALKSQLFVQIYLESALICFFGLLLGALLAYLLLPEFNATFNTRLTLGHLLQPGFLAFIGGMFLVVTLIAGGYPAWLMAKFNAVAVLKGKISLKRPGFLRNSLLVTQFALSCLLTCCTLIALQQVDYLRQKPLGFEKEQLISIPVGNQVNGRQVLARLRQKLASDPCIRAVTGSNINLGKGKDNVSSRTTIGFTYQGQDIQTDWVGVDYDYLKTLQIPLINGREFEVSYAADSVNRVIITESLAEQMGEKQALGKFLDINGQKQQIIGIIPDFNLYSAAAEKRPITLHLSASEPINYLLVRVSPQSLKTAMNKMHKLWRELAPGTEFTGSFMEENIDAWYQEEEKMAQICSLASGIAIALSVSGLFAVALLVMEQRTKEIGIRKVLGAQVSDILFILSKDFVRLVILALLLAMPLAWFLMHQWLNQYAYRITINPLIFLGVGTAAILLTLVTVGFQSVKAAVQNPVKSLKTE
ncbi:ABC transporter permease [Adhaeribacter swui]|uniref:ABC transporter permease n=2 Tax=Adhaeribacter swui TaxID=2086471 RepID=A0A7G7GFE9_9BACT|nr:ABC transporter permease [Adhaeribacter swui]